VCVHVCVRVCVRVCVCGGVLTCGRAHKAKKCEVGLGVGKDGAGGRMERGAGWSVGDDGYRREHVHEGVRQGRGVGARQGRSVGGRKAGQACRKSNLACARKRVGAGDGLQSDRGARVRQSAGRKGALCITKQHFRLQKLQAKVWVDSKDGGSVNGRQIKPQNRS